MPRRVDRFARQRQWLFCAGLLAATILSVATGRTISAQVELPGANLNTVIDISADQGSRWQQGEFEVWYLRGRCMIRQARMTARGDQAIIWVDRAAPNSQEPHQVLAYLEAGGDNRFVQVEFPRDSDPRRGPSRGLVDKTWYGEFHSRLDARMNVLRLEPPPPQAPDILPRATAARRATMRSVQPAQFTAPEPIPTPTAPTLPGNARRIQILPRGSVPYNVKTINVPERNEQILIIDSGVKVIIEGARLPGLPDLGRIVLETDRIAIWTSGIGAEGISGESIQSGETPLEFYLEGNIVFSQGQRVIYAERMYYNVPQRYGTVLNAEMLTPVDQFEGLLRLKANVLQQVNEQNFIAYGGAFTSSRLGVPRYWLQSEELTFQDNQTPIMDPLTGQPAVNPSGDAVVDHDMLITGTNNFVYVAGIPVLFYPRLATRLDDPLTYLERLSIRQDSIFGTQILTKFDLYQILGIQEPPEGTRWRYSVDSLSERGSFFKNLSGTGVGTDFQYSRNDLLGFQGPAAGTIDIWGIRDEGLDNLGGDRRAIVPDEEYRGRAFARHRQQLDIGPQVTAEVGWQSDRTFLEQYYEFEWDQQKDQTTGAELKWLRDDHSLNLTVDGRLNDFYTQTEWLPRIDHFVLGHSLLFDRLTWYGHSHAGYGRFRVLDPPANPVLAGQERRLAWEMFGGLPADRQGVRAGTRQEIDAPVDVGPVRVVPYLLGDATYWQEDLAAADVTRLYGQAGIRGSIPFWRADPSVQSYLLNLNGLAHKIVVDGEFSWSDASQDLGRFPLYDQLDDDAQEFFRRRFFSGAFAGAPGGVTPLRFDERFFAFRGNMQGNVTAPSAEIADDLMLGRLGVRQRWQTKRGLPGQERIVDWITFDVEGAVFPRPTRDNFGSNFGMFNYDFRWHVGDRLAVLSDGYADFFSEGLRTASLGTLMSRPEVGSLYVGFRSIEGPISSNLLIAALNYRMSEKWITTAATTYDFGQAGNIGQTISFTRVGESAFISLAMVSDISRGIVGVQLAIEPRFLPVGRLGYVGGVQIPPAGARGLE